MLLTRFVFLCLLSPLLMLAASRPAYIGLPDHAVLLEEQPLPVWAHAHRALVLWVLAPANKPLQRRTLMDETDSSPEEDYDYTCPEQTTGHFYRAPTHVSLVDTQSRRVLNTVPVKLTGADTYDVPFRIRPGYFYHVRGPLTRGAGKPHILALRDFNGDGNALEFAFHVMESCSGPLTMVLGYSVSQDRVIVYEFLLQGAKPDGPQSWMYRFTFRKPIAPMHWRYDDWYNSGRHIEYDFRYLAERERFEGTARIRDIDLNQLKKK